jgi:hypothetical protein
MDLPVSRDFDLWFTQDGDGLTVTKFEGGGWDEEGLSMRGRYVRTEPRPRDPAPPTRDDRPDTWSLTTGEPRENLRVITHSRGVTSTYEEDGERRSISTTFKLGGSD